MASRNIADCTPKMQEVWKKASRIWAEKYPQLPQPFLTCTHRSLEEQEILYMMDKNGRDDDGDGRIDESDEWRSNAKPGESEHNELPSRAFDIAFKNKAGKLDWSIDLFKKFSAIAKPLGVEWGGDWRRFDGPHFQEA